MRKSFKEIIETFETFASDHKVIKQFKANPLSEFTAKNYLYPLQWVEIVGSTLDSGEVKINLNIYFVDLLKTHNYIKILSDTLRLCTDFYSYFNNNSAEFGFVIKNDIPCKPVEYSFDDNVCGHKMEIVVQVPFDKDENEIPI